MKYLIFLASCLLLSCKAISGPVTHRVCSQDNVLIILTSNRLVFADIRTCFDEESFRNALSSQDSLSVHLTWTQEVLERMK